MKTVHNSSHWNKFYKTFNLKEETPFARFVIKKIIPKKKFLDIGCGNGRDTIFFKKKKLKVLGLDNSKVVIKMNKLKDKKIFKYFNFCNKKISLNKFDYIYARFFLHAINEKDEYNFFKNCKRISKQKTLIFLEFRTTKDNMFKKGKHISKYERFYGHYRRFIDIAEFKKKLKKFDFKLIYFKVGIKLAIFNNDNPYICRAIIQNKSLSK